MEIKIKIAGNITYNGFMFTTPLFLEYQHTGQQFHVKGKCTSDKGIAEEWKQKGKKVIIKSGYYFIKRIAIPTINAKGENDIWYISNCGDTHSINKISKYGKKIHAQLSQETIIGNL